jgi:predicted HTH domain antitoxin
MTTTLPNDTLAANSLGEKEIKQELALTLYSRRSLTLIQAADLADTGFFEFQQLLRERSIPQHYSLEDLAADKLTLGKIS